VRRSRLLTSQLRTSREEDDHGHAIREEANLWQVGFALMKLGQMPSSDEDEWVG